MDRDGPPKKKRRYKLYLHGGVEEMPRRTARRLNSDLVVERQVTTEYTTDECGPSNHGVNETNDNRQSPTHRDEDSEQGGTIDNAANSGRDNTSHHENQLNSGTLESEKEQEADEPFDHSANCGSWSDDNGDQREQASSDGGNESENGESGANDSDDSNASGEDGSAGDHSDEGEADQDQEVQLQEPSLSHHRLRNELLKLQEPRTVESHVTQGEALLMALAVAHQNKTSYKAFVDIVKFANALFLTPILPKSAYLLDQYLNSTDGFKRHFYCENACMHLGFKTIK